MDDELPTLPWDQALLAKVTFNLNEAFEQVAARSPGKMFSAQRDGDAIIITRTLADKFRAPILRVQPVKEPNVIEIIDIDPDSKAQNKYIWGGAPGKDFDVTILGLTEGTYTPLVMPATKPAEAPLTTALMRMPMPREPYDAGPGSVIDAVPTYTTDHFKRWFAL